MPEFADAVIGKHGGSFDSPEGEGLRGTSNDPNHGGVVGVNNAGGDAGFFAGNVGITGHVTANHGGGFESPEGEGLRGTSNDPNHGGVVGVNNAGGDAGFFAGNVGITGHVTANHGGGFESPEGEGLRGTSNDPNHGGVVGVNNAG